ncbi:unnamed protein product [Cochlearia groenlandica]
MRGDTKRVYKEEARFRVMVSETRAEERINGGSRRVEDRGSKSSPEQSLNCLKIRLHEIFMALSDYTHVCSDSYDKLRIISPS